MNDRASDPLNRRFEGGQLKGFMPAYVVNRDKAIESLLSEITANGEFNSKLLERPELAQFDERVVEYAKSWQIINELRENFGSTLCDVGCVLNNELIKSHLVEHTSFHAFANPALEKLVYDKNFAYFLGDIRTMNIPPVWSFDCVTCLSTLEHLGMDNTRYGGDCADFEGEIENPQRFAIEGLLSVKRLVATGGKLMLSVPFGPFEYVKVFGQPEKPIYYTFDQDRLNDLVSVLDNFEVKISIYYVIKEKGWYLGTVSDYNSYYRHAENCAAAGAVAIVEGYRKF